jgi:hypothetical protein
LQVLITRTLVTALSVDDEKREYTREYLLISHRGPVFFLFRVSKWRFYYTEFVSISGSGEFKVAFCHDLPSPSLLFLENALFALYWCCVYTMYIHLLQIWHMKINNVSFRNMLQQQTSKTSQINIFLYALF